jgi:hypothetical protein
MPHKLKDLKSKINSGNFPSIYPHFGGANLIITDKPDRKFHDSDIVVYSEHASALSWLVGELKLIYESDLNHLNKYSFYPYIGELINQTLTKQELLFETMLIVVDQIEHDWGVL